MQDNPIASAILGVGIDITDVARIRNMLDKYADTFLQKTYTQTEIDLCKKKGSAELSFAARFAAKEAVVKSLGTGFRDGITPKSIEILNNELGAPIVNLDKNATLALERIGGKKILVSLTHLKDYAQAIAIVSK